MKTNWEEDYWKLIKSENFEEAIPLKLDNFPSSFFKFRTLSKRTIDTIELGYVWLADIGSLNDPFECSIQFDNDECLRLYYGSDKFHKLFTKITGQSLTEDEIQILSSSEIPFLQYSKICKARKIPFNLSQEEQLLKVQGRWSEIVEETNRSLRICSFSLNNYSLLLWSHYANEHKGIALEYEFLDVDNVRPFIQPIVYSDKVYKIGIFEHYSSIQMIASSLIKSKDWEYEQEWRLTTFKQKDNFPQTLSIPNPIAIYLGTRFHQNDKLLQKQLFEIAKRKNISVFQMEKHPNEFKLIRSSNQII